MRLLENAIHLQRKLQKINAMKRLTFLLLLLPLVVRAYEGPTMGWSSWNAFSVWISEDIIKGQADALKEKGLDQVGYKYVNIDDGFQNGRDAKGKLQINLSRFPNGLKPVVDYIHSQGLKAGIYSDAGDLTCGSIGQGEQNCDNVGFYAHEQQDADFYFKECGFDFIKVDFCGASHLGLDAQQQYTRIHDAIVATGCDVRYNLCCWCYPGTWAYGVSSSWRTTGDINASWGSIKSILAENLYLSAYSINGCHNDMDMLEVGRGTLSDEENKTHFGMWCIMSSPLLIGCDINTISDKTLQLLKNTELIAINQDVLGLQAEIIQHRGDTWVLAKDLETLHGCKRAVALYNPSDKDTWMSISLSELELAGEATVRDVYEHQDLPTTSEIVSAFVPAHGTRIYVVEAAERIERMLFEAETAYMSCYQEVSNNTIEGKETGIYNSGSNVSGGYCAAWLGSRDENDLQWRNVYSIAGGEYKMVIRGASKETRKIKIDVNGEYQKTVSVTTSDWGVFGDFNTTITLQPGENVIRFHNGEGFMPDIDYMTLENTNGERLIDRNLRLAIARLKALSESHPLTPAFQESVTTLLASASAEGLTDARIKSYITSIETKITNALSIIATIGEYTRLSNLVQETIEVSVESEALTKLITAQGTADNKLSAAITGTNATSALTSLRSALRTYLLNETALPQPGKEMDMTLLVNNSDFSTESGWMGTTPTYRDNCGEQFKKTFDMYQTLSNMKPGKYTLSCNALYRMEANDGGAKYKAGTEVIPAVLYINSESTPLASLYSEEWPESENYNEWDRKNGYPHSMAAAEARFSEGCYHNEVTLKLEQKSTLRFGIKSTHKSDDSWCCFDNFRLKMRNLNDEDTSIESLSAKEDLNAPLYNLSGQRISVPTQQGIYIRNGRKFILRK